MTDQEIKEWLWLLSHDPTEQKSLVEDLLDHRIGDEMSDEDKSICRRALELLA